MNFSIKNLILPLALSALVFSSCDKAETTDQLGDKGFKMLKFVGVGGTAGDNFKTNSNLALDPSASDEDVVLNLEYSASQVLDHDIVATVGVNPALVAAYNATVPTGGNIYTLLPASNYSLPTTTVTIKAGQIISEPFVVRFHPDQIDPSINYMLPLTILSVTGAPSDVIIAPGTGIAYLHLIGNPLAGNYHSTGYLYHPASPRAIDEDKTLSAVDAVTLQMDLGDLGASGYKIWMKVNAANKVTIEAAPGAAGAPYVQFDAGLPSSNPGYSPAWPGSAQCNNTYDPATKTFYLRYGYVGATGYRVAEEIVKKR